MNEQSSALRRAKKIAGGNAGLGRLLGISPQAVSQWRQIPADRVVDVERATGVSRLELRPDIFRAPREPAAGSGASGREGQFSRFEHLRRAHFASTEDVVEHVRALRDEWDRR